MYSNGTGIAYGFHGCDRTIAEKIVNKELALNPSNNDYDWLGNGMYFWENSPSRAMDYAKEIQNKKHKGKTQIKEPAVVRAIIHLGKCLDLLDYKNLKLVKESYELLKSIKMALPKNLIPGARNQYMLRKLDCTVIEALHMIIKKAKVREFDSVRGVFWEGNPLVIGK